jgi:hypothetical protein
MNKIYVKLESRNTPKIVDGSLKKGNTYVIYVNENFEVRENLEDLVNELNFQLKKDNLEPLNYRDRKLERELTRLQLNKVVDVNID